MGFVIEEVELWWSSTLKEVDDSFGFWGDVSGEWGLSLEGLGEE